MFYYSEQLLDSLLLSDIEYGDLTTRLLAIGNQQGVMTFCRKAAGRVSGLTLSEKLLNRLSLTVVCHVSDGMDVEQGAILLTVYGHAAQLHQGWKVVQNILEWSCGVAHYMAQMVAIAKQINPQIRIACTRKSIPGTKTLSIAAISHGEGILHRSGTAESVLLFANHRRFWPDPNDWLGMVNQLRCNAPEKKIIVEADNMNEALQALVAQPDILQLDKFNPKQVRIVMFEAKVIAPHCVISIAGGVNLNNIADFAQSGVPLIITSAPYYAAPDDIKVVLEPI